MAVHLCDLETTLGVSDAARRGRQCILSAHATICGQRLALRQKQQEMGTALRRAQSENKKGDAAGPLKENIKDVNKKQ